MRLNLIRFKVAAKKRNERKENLPIGSAIKFKRRELHMTLEEASKDICSISYLSKLENNIIVPNDVFVNQLKRRFCLQEDESMDDTFYQASKKQLIGAMLNDQKIKLDVSHMAHMQTDYQTMLLQFGIDVLHHKSKEVYDSYQKITSVISSMPDEEFSILGCLISRILYDEARYQESDEVLAMIPVKHMDARLKLYRDRMTLINAIHLGNAASFHMNYPRYQEQLLHLGLYKQINELRQQTLIYFAGITNVKNYHILLHQNHRISSKFKHFVRGINHVVNGEYEVVIKQTKGQFEKLDNRWLILNLIALDGLENKQLIKQAIKIGNHRNFTYNQALLFNYIKSKYNYEKASLLVYLRTFYLVDHFLIDDVRILAYFQKQAHQIFKSYFYYKEAAEVYTKYNRMIDTLKRSNHITLKELDSSFYFMHITSLTH